MNLGKQQVELYKRGALLGELSIGIGVISLLAIFFRMGQAGDTFSFIVTGCFFLIAAFFFWIKNDGCYLYDYGLEIVRWKRVKTFLYQDIQSVTTCQKWRIALIGTHFISIRKVTYPVFILQNNQQIRLFFEADNHVIAGLYQCAKFK